MATGYIEDGNFVNTENKTRARQCDVCGNVREQSDEPGTSDGYQFVRADSLGFDDMVGMADVCDECLLNGIGEEGREKLKNQVFEEREEESVEL